MFPSHDPWNLYPQPKKVFFDNNGKQDFSTASGRYQFLRDTWNELSNNNGLKDFGVYNQDIGAILLASAQPNFIRNLETDNYQAAFTNIKSIWASLPSAWYGQPEKEMADTLSYFENRLFTNTSLYAEVEDWIVKNRPSLLV